MQFIVGSSFAHNPEMLLESQKSVPVDGQDFIPLNVHGRSFSKVQPSINRCGSQAV